MTHLADPYSSGTSIAEAPSPGRSCEGEPLIDRLVREGPAFDLWQAVYLLHQAIHGDATEKSAEASLRIRPSEQRSFPPSNLRSVHREPSRDGTTCVVVTATRMGLYGADAALPPHDYNGAISRDEQPSTALRSFLDIFHHRIYTLRYRARARVRPSLHSPGEAAPDLRNARRYVSLAGLDATQIDEDKPSNTIGDDRLPVTPLRLAAYAGRLCATGRNAEGLETLLEAVLPDLAVRVEEHVLRQRPIPYPLQLGRDAPRLGQAPPLGRTVRDRSSAFRIHIGPLRDPEFADLLPGGALAERVGWVVRHFVPDLLDYDVRLHLHPSVLTDVVLGGRDTQLGTATVLGRPRDAATRTVNYTTTDATGSVQTGTARVRSTDGATPLRSTGQPAFS